MSWDDSFVIVATDTNKYTCINVAVLSIITEFVMLRVTENQYDQFTGGVLHS